MTVTPCKSPAHCCLLPGRGIHKLILVARLALSITVLIAVGVVILGQVVTLKV